MNENNLIEKINVKIPFLLAMSYVLAVVYLHGFYWAFSLQMSLMPVSILDVTAMMIKISPILIIFYICNLVIFNYLYNQHEISKVAQNKLEEIELEITSIDSIVSRKKDSLEQLKNEYKNFQEHPTKQMAESFINEANVVINDNSSDDEFFQKIVLKLKDLKKEIGIERANAWYRLITQALLFIVALLVIPEYYMFGIQCSFYKYHLIFSIHYLLYLIFSFFPDGIIEYSKPIFFLILSLMSFSILGYINGKELGFFNKNYVLVEIGKLNLHGNIISLLDKAIILRSSNQVRIILWSGITDITYLNRSDSYIPPINLKQYVSH